MSGSRCFCGFCSLIILSIMYRAHKAAHPEQFPIRDTTRALYPALYGIEERFKGKPTPVHLQVYDDTAHVLPVLFSFTTPAKYCFRAMAQFCKYVTGMPLFPTEINDADTQPNTQSNSQTPSQNPTGDSSSAGFFASLSSSIASSLAGNGAGERERSDGDPGTSTSPPAVSPRSPRSIGSISSRFSIRRKGRKSTTLSNSASNSDLKRSVSEHHGAKFPLPLPHQNYKKGRSLSVPRLRKRVGSDGPQRDGEDGDTTEPEGDKHVAGEEMEGGSLERAIETIPKNKRRHDIPPVPLPLSPRSLFSTNMPSVSPLSIPLPPSPRSPSSNYEQPSAPLTDAGVNASFSMSLSADSNDLLEASAIVDGPYLTASPTASAIPLPSFEPPSSSISTSLSEVEGLPLSDGAISHSLLLSGPPSSSSVSRTLQGQAEVSIGPDRDGEREQEDLEGEAQNGERYAGDPIVYSETAVSNSLFDRLILIA